MFSLTRKPEILQIIRTSKFSKVPEGGKKAKYYKTKKKKYTYIFRPSCLISLLSSKIMFYYTD